MNFQRLDLFGTQTIGVYLSTSNEYALVPHNLEEKEINAIEDTLEVKTIKTTVGESNLLGSLTEINSNGIIVSGIATEDEIDTIKENGLNFGVISEKMNTSGNLVLANDKLALTHPDLPKEELEKVEDVLDVEVIRTSISGIKTVGSAAVITNKGILLHPMVRDEKITEISNQLGIKADVGTVNYGMPLIGSGMVANDNGFLVGSRTTGPELGRLEEILYNEEV
ncbi:MAG: Translation initiation factor 6 [Candidatus Methanohalarchaeum thermophilum]|uniref:Translation initiation factor 6 n=1 Tax=Methanohalarchaeum thermophilum TaxID=1903181 RepID=A0A1Q6DXW6_METT1|nr:MAG: Translation initiation factor 6 [Candidatus Methanohalarchaeum thermophilum]